MAKADSTPTICAIDNCERTIHCKGFCGLHYRRFRDHGDPNYVRPSPICSIIDCNMPNYSNKLCSFHYNLARSNGSLPWQKECSVEGCTKYSYSKKHGLCSGHDSKRNKYGDPLIQKRPSPGVPMSFLLSLIGTNSKECIKWPYATLNTGYGTVEYERKTKLAHRHILSLVAGEPISEDMHAAHSCNNGHLGCVNPNHLSWKSPSENEVDKIENNTSPHGERSSFAKLSNEDALSIFTDPREIEIIASEYNLSIGAIKDIKIGRRWNLITGAAPYVRKYRRPALSDKNAILIYSSTKDINEIALEFGVSIDCVKKIKNGTNRSKLTGHTRVRFKNVDSK